MTRRPSVLTVAIVVPALVTLGAVVASALLVPGAADPVAIHWGPSGEADGFAAPATVVAITAVTGIGLTTLFGVLLLTSGARPGRPSRQHKLVATIAASATALVAALNLWTLAAQRAGSEPPTAGAGLAIAFAAAALVGIGTWLLMPPAAPSAVEEPRAGHPVTLGDDERVAWVGSARMPRAAVLLIGAVLQVDAQAWPVLFVPAMLGVLFFALVGYTVRIDARGLEVRSVLGLPVWRIRPGQIAAAGVVDVSPLIEFGGWGIRLGTRRRTGVITRAGEAIEVRRRSGRALVVTVDDAATAAGLLTAIAARAARGAR